MSDSAPIFCGGCSRSGTTLIYALLNAHSKIWIGLETALMMGNRDLDHISRRTGISKVELTPLYRKANSYPEFAERVLASGAQATAKARWGDKSPANVTLIDGILRFFPNARFIHMIRDGRDVVCSMRHHPASFGNKHALTNPWIDCIERWDSRVRAGRRFLDDSRYIEVKYENLVERPEETLRELFRRIGERWEDAVLVKAQQESVRTHPEVSRPINESSRGRWNDELPRCVRNLFRGSAARLLVELGYESDDAWISG